MRLTPHCCVDLSHTTLKGAVGNSEVYMGIRYLGSKARVLEDLAHLIGHPGLLTGRFVDAFSGTGAVASLAADLGWAVHVNDHLHSAKILSTARLLAKTDVPYSRLGGYSRAIETLNAANPTRGFLWREYSPASAGHAPRPRRYFTTENAARLDGMRAQIRRWKEEHLISYAEETLLLADLMEAASAVANTAGTFGCFLSGWLSTALRQVTAKARALRTRSVCFTSGEQDVFLVQTEPQDTVYLDPPYTKRQYAAYYHVLETLAHGDEPRVSGVTGLRPWEAKASPFNYKRLALSALLSLVENTRAARVLVSYSSDGHVDLQELGSGLKTFGTVETHKLRDIPRYQPRGVSTTNVGEFVIDLRREMAK